MLQIVARRVPPVEQELLTFPGSHGILGVVRVTQSFVFCVVFYQTIVCPIVLKIIVLSVL